MVDDLWEELLDLDTNDDAELSERLALSSTRTTTTYQMRKRKRIAEILNLRRTIYELEGILASLQRKASANSIQQLSDGSADNMWMAIALRQHRRLHASQSENRKLLAQVNEQATIAQRLARLVLHARNTLQVPREIPTVYSSPESTSIADQLTKLTTSMVAIVDTILCDTTTPSEFQKLTLSQRNPHDITIGSAIASMTAGRFVHQSRDAISDCLWNCRSSHPPGPVRLQLLHQEQGELRQKVYYHLLYSTPQGVLSFHVVSIGLRRHESSRTIHAFSSVTWPDTKTPAPWSAINFLVRDWTVIQPLAQANAHHVRSCSQSFRYAHPHPPSNLTPHEAAALQDFVVQTHQRDLNRKYDCIDDLLVQRTSVTV